MSDKTTDVTFYVQVEPEWYPSGAFKRAKAVRVSQSWPASPIGGAVLTKLTLRLPVAAFLPLQPAVVEVPADAVEVTLAAEPAEGGVD